MYFSPISGSLQLVNLSSKRKTFIRRHSYQPQTSSVTFGKALGIAAGESGDHRLDLNQFVVGTLAQ